LLLVQACCLTCILYFFFMARRPPRSTLFPTRRSSDLDGWCGAGAPRWNIGIIDADGAEHTVFLGCNAATHSPGGTDGWRSDSYSDRKSTRLNSSHVSISYAVFCLKKKKENERHRVQQE